MTIRSESIKLLEENMGWKPLTLVLAMIIGIDLKLETKEAKAKTNMKTM